MDLSKISRNLYIQDNNLPLLGMEDYRRTAVAIPLIQMDGDWHILFEERAQHIPQGGEICFPGGRMDEQDAGDGKKTALRETCEELGLEVSDIEILGALGREPGMRAMLVDVYVAQIRKSGLQDIPFNEEVARIITIPLQYFIENPPQVHQVAVHISHTVKDIQGREQELMPVKELKLPPLYHKPWGHRKQDVYFYETEQATIWGLTARILKYFIRSLEE